MADATLNLAAALTAVGLAVGTAAYYLLIRRRRRTRDGAQERMRMESNRRAMARFRRLRRHDDV